jgi:DNA-binding Lrp family transcriptional regulator
MRTNPQTPQGVAKRHSDWEDITEVSSVGRTTLQAVPNYRLFKAATRATAASPQARLLLVHLIGYLGADRVDDPAVRFIAFPGNTRLADELGYSKRTIQRLADELEEKGLMRRCYNGLNRRVGFDLTPLAMQQDMIEANIVEIQTKRKAERDELQLELSLAANRIARPIPVQDLTPQGDNPVIHNRSTDSKSADGLLSEILDSVETALTSKLSGDKEAQQDRTEADDALRESYILRHLTGSGRAAHLGWTLAKRTLGFEHALALCAIAESDPKRKSSTDRYFSWLLKMIMTGDGHAIVSQAAERANSSISAATAKLRSPSAPAEVEAAIGEDPAMKMFREAIRAEIGAPIYDSWFGKVRLSKSGNVLTLSANTPFSARWIEDNLGNAIAYTVQTAANSQQLKVEYRVA